VIACGRVVVLARGELDAQARAAQWLEPPQLLYLHWHGHVLSKPGLIVWTQNPEGRVQVCRGFDLVYLPGEVRAYGQVPVSRWPLYKNRANCASWATCDTLCLTRRDVDRLVTGAGPPLSVPVSKLETSVCMYVAGMGDLQPYVLVFGDIPTVVVGLSALKIRRTETSVEVTL